MIIKIKNLKIRCIIGINDWEKNHLQDLIINVHMEVDGHQVAKTDNIADTVNYKDIKHRIMDFVEHQKFNLVETLAHRLIKLLMEDKRIKRVIVEIDKPQALRFADSVSITVSSE